MADIKTWNKLRSLTPEKETTARQILADIRQGKRVLDAIRRYPLPGGGYISKSMLITVYRANVAAGELLPEPDLLSKLRMKPVRTLSGVTTVTVLTKPYPCPGKCIFCPTDVRMPKSYLPDEPGAMRALQHAFDPYDQVVSRLAALEALGHPTDKIELLILGGTWNSYRRDYQEWFVLRCYEALNGKQAESVSQAQLQNELAAHRNVGLAVETRPDHIDPDELAWFRYLGVTKVQMGVQSLDDQILGLNKRGHTVEETRIAVSLLRAAGFKIVLHWMPNLLGATIDSDRQDFARLFFDLCPDELKIYPTQLLENADLYQYWQDGQYQPYSTEELVQLIADIKPGIPRYCRVNRVIRDIPSTHVVEGNKRTSLRQDIQNELRRRGKACQCIRCREIRSQRIESGGLTFEELIYQAGDAEEHFLSYVTADDYLAGFLRLSLPVRNSSPTGIADLDHAAIVREIHVYGQSLQVGQTARGAAQHVGLGSDLLLRAEEIARQRDYNRMAVIAAVGTRRYYLRRGYHRGNLYLIKELNG